jgi:hypothetical protein
MYKKIKQYLNNKGVKIEDVLDHLEIRDDSNGKGPFISKWEIKGIEKPSEEVLSNIEIKNKIFYIEERKREYPSIIDQLDTLYHGGIEEWRASIKQVKDKYPKPE